MGDTDRLPSFFLSVSSVVEISSPKRRLSRNKRHEPQDNLDTLWHPDRLPGHLCPGAKLEQAAWARIAALSIDKRERREIQRDRVRGNQTHQGRAHPVRAYQGRRVVAARQAVRDASRRRTSEVHDRR